MSRAFTDRYGTALQIGGEASFAGCARLTVSKLCGIHVEAADFPALIAALHEAAGLPAPVILERLDRAACDQHYADGVRTYVAEGRLVGIDGPRDDFTPAAARFLAVRLASLADIAEGEPDPAEVGELAAVIAADRYRAGHPHELDLHTAEVILRAGWKRGAP